MSTLTSRTHKSEFQSRLSDCIKFLPNKAVYLFSTTISVSLVLTVPCCTLTEASPMTFKSSLENVHNCKVLRHQPTSECEPFHSSSGTMDTLAPVSNSNTSGLLSTTNFKVYGATGRQLLSETIKNLFSAFSTFSLQT